MKNTCKMVTQKWISTGYYWIQQLVSRYLNYIKFWVIYVCLQIKSALTILMSLTDRYCLHYTLNKCVCNTYYIQCFANVMRIALCDRRDHLKQLSYFGNFWNASNILYMPYHSEKSLSVHVLNILYINIM